MPAGIRSFLPYRQKLARILLRRPPDAYVENSERSRSWIIPVSRPSAALGRWPKASLYTGMIYDPRSMSRPAADAMSEFDGKKLRIHTGANTPSPQPNERIPKARRSLPQGACPGGWGVQGGNAP